MASLSLKLLQAANKLFSAENRHVGHKLTNSLWSCYMTAKLNPYASLWIPSVKLCLLYLQTNSNEAFLFQPHQLHMDLEMGCREIKRVNQETCFIWEVSHCCIAVQCLGELGIPHQMAILFTSLPQNFVVYHYKTSQALFF